MGIKRNIITGSAEAIKETDQNYSKVLIALYLSLAEKSFSHLIDSDGAGKGFPFSFTGDDGLFHLGIVFDSSAESAKQQLSQFKYVVESRAFDSDDKSHFIDGFMTKEMIFSKIKQSAFELPLLNYKSNN